MTFMNVITTFTFCCDNLWKSKFMALEKPGKLGEFFSPTFWPPCTLLHCDIDQLLLHALCCSSAVLPDAKHPT